MGHYTSVTYHKSLCSEWSYLFPGPFMELQWENATVMANHYTRAVPEIDDGQREELERWLRRSKTGQALALGTRIVLASAGVYKYGIHLTPGLAGVRFMLRF